MPKQEALTAHNDVPLVAPTGKLSNPASPKNASKITESAIRHHGTLALNASHPAIRKLKRQGFEPTIHGHKVWRSSFVVMNYLKHHPLPTGARAMDIGCGWGLTGIFLAKRFGAEVTGIDADANVKPYLEAQARENGVSIAFEHKKFEQIRRKDLRGVHTLMGSDICFWDEMVNPLFNLVKRAQEVGVARVLIADPGRSPFWELAAQCERKFNGTVVEHRISKPFSTSKHLLLIESHKR